MTPSTDAAPPPTGTSALRWWVCLLLLLASTLNYMDRTALNQTINKIKVEFDFNDTQYGRLESAFAIAFGIGTLIAGWTVDRVNVRWIYPIFVLGWSIVGFSTSYATGFLSLLFCRFMLGIFEAGNWPCGVRTTRTVMKPEERSMGNALFQSGTALGAIITPQIVLYCLYYYGDDEPGVWAVPFRIIGVIGLFWALAWWLTVPARLLPDPAPPSNKPREPFWPVLADGRFWLMVLVVIGVNTSWHTFRIWMPRYLKEQQQFTEVEIQQFGTWYYIFADIGIWSVGLLTMLLVKLRLNLFGARMITFLLCAACVMVAIQIPFLTKGQPFQWLFLVYSFGSLGLFATYFALTQEITNAHQGKVTGSLGAINSVYLALMSEVQGRFVTATGRFDWIMSVAWVPAVASVIAVILFWPRNVKERDA